RRGARTSTTRTWRRGSSPVSARRRCGTSSRSPSNTSSPRNAATSKVGTALRAVRHETTTMPLTLNLKIWRQAGPDTPGRLVDYKVGDISPEMSFLEMLDVVNEQLITRGEEPIAFDSDCREGICGTCGIMVDGVAHGPDPGTTVCQLHMRRFKDGETITIEPWRA